MNRSLLFLLTLGVWGLSACDKQLENINPQASLDIEAAITNAANSEVALSGAYDIVQSANYYGNQLTYFGDLPADNTFQSGTFPSLFEMDNNALLPNNANVTNAWVSIYNGVNRANNLIEKVPTLTDATLDNVVNGVKGRDRILGEALFLRGFHYFTLVRYWGGVPLVLSPTKGISEASRVSRNTEAEVYAQVIKDLTQAEGLLPVTYANAIELRGRATKATAQALLSRAYLYTKQWKDAADKAALVIANTNYRLLPSYAAIFTTKNTSESVWELQFNPTDQNGVTFHYLAAPQGRRENAPATALLNAYDPLDQRLAASVAKTGAAALTQANAYVSKYNRASTQDDPVFLIRIAEVILNRAEALAEQSYPSAEALVLLNQVRARAGLPALTTTELATLANFRLAMEKERQLEFAFEGHRWSDLRRTGRAAEVLKLTDPNRLLFPIPERERNANPNITQNPGY